MAAAFRQTDRLEVSQLLLRSNCWVDEKWWIEFQLDRYHVIWQMVVDNIVISYGRRKETIGCTFEPGPLEMIFFVLS